MAINPTNKAVVNVKAKKHSYLSLTATGNEFATEPKAVKSVIETDDGTPTGKPTGREWDGVKARFDAAKKLYRIRLTAIKEAEDKRGAPPDGGKLAVTLTLGTNQDAVVSRVEVDFVEDNHP